jgi:hypothetical protein
VYSFPRHEQDSPGTHHRRHAEGQWCCPHFDTMQELAQRFETATHVEIAPAPAVDHD